MKANFELIVLVMLILLLQSCSSKLNLYKNGKQHGKWKYETSKKDFSVGRFSQGRFTGKWKTVVDGEVYKISRYRNEREYIKLYHPNGILKAKGLAITDTITKLVNDTLVKEVHWYYSGKWRQYKSNGKLLRIETYEKGEWIDDPWSEKDSIQRDNHE